MKYIKSKSYELFNDDCIEVIKKIPDNSIDIIVTDPPYLINYKTSHRKDKTHKFCKTILNDNNYNLVSNYIAECYRILKNNKAMYMFCSSKTIDFFKECVEDAGFAIKNLIVWEKNNHTAGDLVAQFGQKYEFIILANKGRCPFNGKRLTDIWKFDRVAGKKQVHQNQKPTDLLAQCIEKHSLEGDVVFDGFMGSGSTGVAALRKKRKFVGIELDKDYFKIAENRIQSASQYMNDDM